MILSKKLGKLNESRAKGFSNLSKKYEKLLAEYVPFTEEEEGKIGEQMVQEIGDIATESIQKRNSKPQRVYLTCRTKLPSSKVRIEAS